MHESTMTSLPDSYRFRRSILSLTALFAVLVILAVSGYRCRGEREVVLAYIAVEDRNHVLLVDPYEAEILGKIYAGDGPESVIARPGTSELWVLNRGGYQTTVIETGTGEMRTSSLLDPVFTRDGSRYFLIADAVYEIDAQNGFLISTTDVMIPDPWRAAATPDGRWLYICQRQPSPPPDPEEGRHYRTLIVYDTERREVAAEIAVGTDPYDIAISPDGSCAITANMGSQDITIIEAATLSPVATIALHRPARSVLMHPDGGRFVVTTDGRTEADAPDEESGGELMSFRIDLLKGCEVTLDDTLRLGGLLESGAYTPQGDRLLILDSEGGRLLILDPDSLTVTGLLPTGPGAREIAFSSVPLRSRERLARQGGPDRARLSKLLQSMRGDGLPFQDMLLVEMATMYGGESGAQSASLQIRTFFRPPGAQRVELGESSIVKWEDGVPLGGQGRLSDLPQSMRYLLFSIYNLSFEKFVQHLSGDFEDGPLHRIGIAADIIHTETIDGNDFYVIGAGRGDYTSNQLWIDARDGRPRRLVEHIPYTPIVREFQFADYRLVAGGRRLPFRTQRFVQQQLVGETQVTDAQFDIGLADSLFIIPEDGTASFPSGVAQEHGAGFESSTGRIPR
jgi:DNA-binding beta-propeller fold protein YncE